jgi:DNA gyrase/topoisomerase IV subunit B
MVAPFFSSQAKTKLTNEESTKIVSSALTDEFFEKIDRDDKKYEDMMLRNFWGSYYLVKFSNQELVQNLNITLKPKSSDATLNFEK